MRALSLAVVVCLTWGVGNGAQAEPVYPPRLTGDASRITLQGRELLTPPATLKPGVKVAETPPVVDVMYYPGQDYEGKPWSVWGDGLAVGNKYYSSIGDHKAPDGNASVYVYDAESQTLKRVLETARVLNMPAGHYAPAKIHSRIDLGRDGWLYFSTHRGSTRITTDAYHYKGDWILRHHPESGETEVVVHAPLPKQCLPTGQLDPERLIFYAGTADGDVSSKRVQFLAYDVLNKQVLYSDDHGPKRAMIFAPSTGRVYFQADGDRGNAAPLVRFDPAHPGPPTPIDAAVGLRAASEETPDGLVITVDGDEFWAFNTRTETAESWGPAAVGTQTYTTTLDFDPTSYRYFYYVPGAHGGSQQDGSPLVQYDVKTRTRKVICFLQPHCHAQTGFVPMGTYGIAVSPDGSKVYITWNGNQGSTAEQIHDRRLRFNVCALTVVHVPESERRP